MASKANIAAQKELLELLSSGNNLVEKSSELLFDQLEAQKNISAKQKDQVKTLNLIVSNEKSSKDINEKINTLKSRAKQVSDKTLEVEIKKLKVQKASTTVVKQQSEALLSGLNKSISLVKKLPGGGLLISAMGLTDENMNKLKKGLGEFITGGRKFTEITKDMPKGFGKSLAKGVALGGAVGLVFGTFKLITKALTFAGSLIDSIGAEFGVIGTNSDKFQKNLTQAGVDSIALGKSISDVVQVTSNLSSEFGISLNAASELPIKVLDTAMAIGISTDEATKLFGTLMAIGGLTADQAERLAENTFQLAAQNDVNPSAVMRDMAGSAELIAEFGADNLKSITKAAVQARRMGLNLNTVSKVANNLLDFQSSITAETEASLMIGRRINLQRAREFALAGDLDKMMKSVLKQVGGQVRFNRLNVLQRRSIAAAVGLEVSEFAKLARAQDKNIVQSKSFVDLLGEDGMSALTSIINKIKMLGAQFLKSFGEPIMEFLEKIEQEFLNPEAMESLKQTFNDLGTSLANTVTAIGQVPGQIQKVKDTAINLGATLGGGYGGAKIGAGIGSIFGPVGTAVGGALGAIGGALAGYFTTNDFISGGGGSHFIVTPKGKLLKTNPKDTVMGSTKVNDFVSGGPGSMPLGGGSNKELIQMIGKLVSQNEELIRETKRSSSRIGDVIIRNV